MTEKENHLPNLSSEERAHALELACPLENHYRCGLQCRLGNRPFGFR